MDPLVSVVIPTFNRAHLIRRALDSVLAQTYKNLDIIVVDDASTDDTEVVIRSYEDSRIRYVRLEHNRGGSAARNVGLRLSKGEYIAFLDSDDEWVADKVRRHLDVFQAHPECHIVYSAVKTVYPDGSVFVRHLDGPEGRIFDRLMVRNVVGPTSAFVIKRECFERVGGFDESLPSSQDYDLWLRLAKHYQFKKISEPLVVYHWHGNQISTNMEAKWRGMLAILEKYRDDLRMYPFAHAEKHYRLGRFLLNHGHMSEGRRHLARAVSIYPWRLRYAAFWGLSLLGSQSFSYVQSLLTTVRWGRSIARWGRSTSSAHSYTSREG